MLRTLTLVITYTGLVTSLWLGLYLVIHNPRRWIGWLTALTLWSITGLFLNITLALNPPPPLAYSPSWLGLLFPFWPEKTVLGGPSNAWLQGWSITPGIALWHHVSVLMRPGRLSGWRRLRILVGYLLAGAAILVQWNTDLILRAGPGDPLYVSTLQAGPLYLLFGVALLAYTGFSMVNLLRSARAAPATMPRYQLNILALATLTAGLIGPFALAGAALGWPIPMAFVSFMLLLAVSLTGYGVANYSALMESRTIRRNFFYNALAIGLVTLVYLAAAWIAVLFFGLPTSAFLIFVLLAVVTHTLTDLGRALLDKIYYGGETGTLRVMLRDSFRLAGDQPDLEQMLTGALGSLCRTVRATQGLIVLFDGDSFGVTAGFRTPNRAEGLSIHPANLAADDVVRLEPGHLPAPLERVTLLVPLYDDLEQIGALLLGHPVNGIQYSDEDINLLLFPSDQLTDRILAHRRLQSNLNQAARLLTESRTVKSQPVDQQVAISEVEDALRHLHDYARLGDSRLAFLHLVELELKSASLSQITHLDRGKAVYQVMEKAVDKLRPNGEPAGDPPPQIWQSFLILHEAYFGDVPNRDIMSRLYISEGTFNRRRRAAVAAVARALGEMEAAL